MFLHDFILHFFVVSSYFLFSVRTIIVFNFQAVSFPQKVNTQAHMLSCNMFNDIHFTTVVSDILYIENDWQFPVTRCV